MNSVALTSFEDPALRPCPLCDSRMSTPVFLTIRQCQDCGLRFVNPLGHFRGEHETEEYFLNEYLPLHRKNWNNSLEERRAHLAMIRQFAALPVRPCLLDVGCALGLMLQEASAAGWNAVGVETSDFAARYAAEHTGCQVYSGTLQEAHLESNSFDVVTLMDVIEHVPNPRALMEEVHRVLRPGGVSFLVTPNFGSLFAKIYRESAYGVGPDEHVTYFQPSTIRRLLVATGFRDIVTGTKDFYAANLQRLIPRPRHADSDDMKTAVGSRPLLLALRKTVNRILMHLPIGDKLVAIGVKQASR